MQTCEFFSSSERAFMADIGLPWRPWRPGLHNGLYPTDVHHADMTAPNTPTSDPH